MWPMAFRQCGDMSRLCREYSSEGAWTLVLCATITKFGQYIDTKQQPLRKIRVKQALYSKIEDGSSRSFESWKMPLTSAWKFVNRRHADVGSHRPIPKLRNSRLRLLPPWKSKLVKASAFCFVTLTERSLTRTALQIFGRLQVRTTHKASQTVAYDGFIPSYLPLQLV
jgi:hypothetical protein